MQQIIDTRPDSFNLTGRMVKLCIFVGTTIGSYAGWWLGDFAGWGLGGAFIVSGIGSILGVYAGWKLAQKIDG